MFSRREIHSSSMSYVHVSSLLPQKSSFSLVILADLIEAEKYVHIWVILVVSAPNLPCVLYFMFKPLHAPFSDLVQDLPVNLVLRKIKPFPECLSSDHGTLVGKDGVLPFDVPLAHPLLLPLGFQNVSMEHWHCEALVRLQEHLHK